MFRNRWLLFGLSIIVLLTALLGARMLMASNQEQEQLKAEAAAAEAMQNDLQKMKVPTHTPVKHKSMKLNFKP